MKIYINKVVVVLFFVFFTSITIVISNVNSVESNDNVKVSSTDTVNHMSPEMILDKNDIEFVNNSYNAIEVDNENGTNSIYIFNDNVGYMNEEGEIVKKDLSLITSTSQQSLSNGYIIEVKENDIKSKFPMSLKDKGFIIQNIEIIPYNSTSVLSDSNNSTVYYEAVFEGVDLNCKPAFQGGIFEICSEDISNYENVKFIVSNENAYNIYYEGGKVIIQDDNSVYEILGSNIIDNEGNVIGYSSFSLEKNNILTMNYELTDAVATSETVTTSFSVSVNAQNIVDTTYFEDYTYSDMGYNYVGSDTEHGITRALVKFDLSALENISYDRVLSAYYSVYVEDYEANKDAYAEVYLVTEYCDYSPDTIDFMPSYAANYRLFTFKSSDVFDQSRNVHVYITSAIKAWLQGMSNNGIMIKSRNDEEWVRFHSASNTMAPPYLCVTYSDENSTSDLKGIDTGLFYYIINKDNRKSLYWNDSDSRVVSADLSLDNYEQWLLLYDSTESGVKYYKIKNGFYNYYLEATSNGNNEYEVFMNVENSFDNQKWRIVRNWDGSYKLVSKSLDGTMAISIDNGSVVLESFSVDFEKNDDWSFIPVNRGNATLYGTCGGCQSIRSLDEITSVQNILTANDFNCYNLHPCESDINTVLNNGSVELASNAITRLFNSDIWYYSTHGEESRMQFVNSDNDLTESRIGVKDGIEIQDDEEDYDPDFNKNVNVYGVSDYNGDLNSLQLAIFNSCSTGADYNNESLLGTMYEEGTKCLLAHTEKVGAGEAKEWQEYFNLALSVSDVETALEFAYRCMLSLQINKRDGCANMWHVLGDTSYFFNYDIFSIESNEYSLLNNSLMSIEINEENHCLNLLPYSFNLTQDDGINSMAVDSDNNEMDIYTDEEGSIYGYSKNTGDLILYNYNHKSSKMGNYEVLPLSARECATDFLNRLGYNNMLEYNETCSNSYSTEYIMKYTMIEPEVGDIENVCVYVENDGSGDYSVTYYIAEYKN